MKAMSEDDFYRMCDIVEEFNDVTGGYYPTVKELKRHKVEEKLDVCLPFLIYYASDPLKRADNPDALAPDYQEAVKYCKELLYNIELKSD